MLIRKVNALIWFCWIKKASSLIEDERKDKAQRTYTRRNPKRHMSLVSLLLWRRMVAVHCFIWPLALQLTVRLKFELAIFKILYPATFKYFVIFNVLYYMDWYYSIQVIFVA